MPRGTVLQRENVLSKELYFLQSGWMYSYVLLDDGSRQILQLYLPGDLIGACGAVQTSTSEALFAITDVTVCPFDKQQLRVLFENHPRIAALIFAISQIGAVAISDRVVSLGRTSARARVAAMLVDILIRLRMMNPGVTDTIPLPLKQEEIGDVTGLTSVHVNRMMRALVEAKLIARANGHVQVLDERRLIQIANYSNRYAAIDTSWLPPSR